MGWGGVIFVLNPPAVEVEFVLSLCWGFDNVLESYLISGASWWFKYIH